MDAFLHQVIAGLATGGIYASLALALVMIYNTHHVNFAQGEMAMFATYLCWTMIDAGAAVLGRLLRDPRHRIRPGRRHRAGSSFGRWSARRCSPWWWSSWACW